MWQRKLDWETQKREKNFYVMGYGCYLLLLLTYFAKLENGKSLYAYHPIKALGLEPIGFSFYVVALRLLCYKDFLNDDKVEFDKRKGNFSIL